MERSFKYSANPKKVTANCCNLAKRSRDDFEGGVSQATSTKRFRPNPLKENYRDSLATMVSSPIKLKKGLDKRLADCPLIKI